MKRSAAAARPLVAAFLAWAAGSLASESIASDGSKFSFLEDARIPSEEGNLVFNEYWSEDGHWVTEGLIGDRICITTYAKQGEVLRQVSREINVRSPRVLGERGSDVQRRIFENWAASVVLIRTNNSLGSGAIVSEDGLILTNRHVVLNSPYVGVSFYEVYDSDGDLMMFRGEVIAADKVRDLALVKVETHPENLKPFEFGDKVEIKPGDEVIAIGHPLGLDWTPTQGTASRVRKDHKWDYRFTNNTADVIQFQTPINPGNSGGPLVNSDGKLIGINSFGMGGQNLNFAIHVSEIKDFVQNMGNFSPSNIHDWLIASSDLQTKLGFPQHARVHQCDFENDGTIDLVRVDRDNNGAWDLMLLDVDCDGTFEFFSMDRDEDGYFELLFLDRNNDDEPDYVFHGNPVLRLPVGVEYMSH